MEDRRLLVIVLGLAVLLAGCENRDNAVGVPPMSLPLVVSLRVGESVLLPSEVSTLTFEKVMQDSRCPVGMECFWQGDAGAKLKIWQSVYSTRDCTLHTALNPRFIGLEGFEVSMKDLLPYPKLGTAIYSSDYVLTLQIDSLHTDQSGRD